MQRLAIFCQGGFVNSCPFLCRSAALLFFLFFFFSFFFNVPWYLHCLDDVPCCLTGLCFQPKQGELWHSHGNGQFKCHAVKVLYLQWQRYISCCWNGSRGQGQSNVHANDVVRSSERYSLIGNDFVCNILNFSPFWTGVTAKKIGAGPAVPQRKQGHKIRNFCWMLMVASHYLTCKLPHWLLGQIPVQVTQTRWPYGGALHCGLLDLAGRVHFLCS